MEGSFQSIQEEKEIELEIEEYCSLNTKNLDKLGEPSIVKRELDHIYEKSPSGSSFSINATRGEESNFQIEIKVSNFKSHFYYQGEHDCLRDGFENAVSSIKAQLRLWRGARLYLYY